jgi:hypothetical protein
MRWVVYFGIKFSPKFPKMLGYLSKQVVNFAHFIVLKRQSQILVTLGVQKI